MAVVKQNQGMTLIELMIVVAIIVIISAIALPAYTGYIKTARRQECQQETSSLTLAQEEYFLEQRTYFTGNSGTGNPTSLETNSTGLWKPAEPTLTNRNCLYTAAAGTTGTIATSYNITALGVLKLNGEGVIATVGN